MFPKHLTNIDQISHAIRLNFTRIRTGQRFKVKIQRFLQHDQAEQHPAFFTADTSSRDPISIVCPFGNAAGSSPMSSAFLLTTR